MDANNKLVVHFPKAGRGNYGGEILLDSQSRTRSKIVFVAGLRDAKNFRGRLPQEGEYWEAGEVKDTKPENPRTGALIVRLVRTVNPRELPPVRREGPWYTYDFNSDTVQVKFRMTYLDGSIETTRTAADQGDEDAARVFADWFGKQFSATDLLNHELKEHPVLDKNRQILALCQELNQRLGHTEFDVFYPFSRRDNMMLEQRLAGAASLAEVTQRGLQVFISPTQEEVNKIRHNRPDTLPSPWGEVPVQSGRVRLPMSLFEEGRWRELDENVVLRYPDGTEVTLYILSLSQGKTISALKENIRRRITREFLGSNDSTAYEVLQLETAKDLQPPMQMGDLKVYTVGYDVDTREPRNLLLQVHPYMDPTRLCRAYQWRVVNTTEVDLREFPSDQIDPQVFVNPWYENCFRMEWKHPDSISIMASTVDYQIERAKKAREEQRVLDGAKQSYRDQLTVLRATVERVTMEVLVSEHPQLAKSARYWMQASGDRLPVVDDYSGLSNSPLGKARDRNGMRQPPSLLTIAQEYGNNSRVIQKVGDAIRELYPSVEMSVASTEVVHQDESTSLEVDPVEESPTPEEKSAESPKVDLAKVDLSNLFGGAAKFGKK